MSLWRQLTRGLRGLVRRRAADRDIADEVDHYLEEAAAELEATGLSPDEARRRARRDLGSLTVVREQVRGYGWENVVDTLIADVRYGLRRLSRNPAFTIVGAITLALGIGASTAIFSAVNPVLFQPLPYPDANRLMMIWDGQNGTRLDVTFGTYRELLARSRSFESMAAMRPTQPTLTGVEEPERLDGQFVSADYFRVLGVRPALGRDFEAADDLPSQPNGPFVAIISDSLWRRRFNTDPALVGHQILLNDVPATVIGIMPRGFENVLNPEAEIWSTLRYDPALPLDGREWGHHLRLIGRLRPDVHVDLAREELNTIAGNTLAEFPRPSWAALPEGFIASPLQDDLTRGVRPALLAILGAVILLLTIACVNATNLLLARGAERRTELVVRAALGASRSRIIRQLLVETVMLAVFGGGLGIVLAHLAVDTLVALSPLDLPRLDAIEVDNQALVFAVTLTTVIGLLVGMVPALQGSRASVQGGGSRPESSRVTGKHQVTRRTLVIVQVALALVLLVAAGLLLRSLNRLFTIPPGFDSRNVLTMQVQTAGRRFRDAETTHRFFSQVIDAVQRTPGVSTAAFTSQLPLTGDEDVWGVHFESVPTAAADESRDGYRYAVSPGYFAAMGIPLRAGRLLTERDDASAPLAVVINESFAKRRIPGINPIGQRLKIGADSSPWFTIVGVVGDVTQMSLAMTRSDAVYLTAAQWRFADNARWLIVRATGNAASLTTDIRRAIASVDSDQPILRVATMDERLQASAADRRFALLLFEAFGLTALLLAAVGTYSLLSGSVTERTREIGVRSALGATRSRIVALVLRQGMTLTGTGIAIGLAGAVISSRALVTLLFGISPLDAVTYLAVAGLLAFVSLVACGMPAWRAARVHPSIALRFE
jgi:putative ABC transport system permease protein